MTGWHILIINNAFLCTFGIINSVINIQTQTLKRLIKTILGRKIIQNLLQSTASCLKIPRKKHKKTYYNRIMKLVCIARPKGVVK